MTKTKFTELEVGSKYESRDGQIWEVIEKTPNPHYPFRAKRLDRECFENFTPHGEVYTDEINDDDLIYKVEPQMTTVDISIDIRTKKELTSIIFSDPIDEDGDSIAYKLTKSCNHKNHVLINDNTDYILIESKEHAENLKKALDKAIELGWIK